jgi:hypothetical protein
MSFRYNIEIGQLNPRTGKVVTVRRFYRDLFDSRFLIDDFLSKYTGKYTLAAVTRALDEEFVWNKKWAELWACDGLTRYWVDGMSKTIARIDLEETTMSVVAQGGLV